jgi:hypothetical protein
MPTVRKLTPAEVETLERRPTSQRQQIEAQYDALLGDYAVGEYGEAALEPDEQRLTVRSRLRAAAGRRGVGLEFRRTGPELLRFRVVEHAPSLPATVTTPAPSTPPPSITTKQAAARSSQATTSRKRASKTTSAEIASAEMVPTQPRRKGTRRSDQLPPIIVSVPASTLAADAAAIPQKRRGRPKKTA